MPPAATAAPPISSRLFRRRSIPHERIAGVMRDVGPLSWRSMSLNGKVVFITGGARGIGAAVATESARRGAKVALAGLEPDELAATAARIGPARPGSTAT